MTRINLNLAIFGTILGYASYILYSDTVSIHGMPSIPTSIITFILTLLIIGFSIPVLLLTDNDRNSKIIRFGLILSIFASVLSGLNYGLNVYFYAVMLILVNLILVWLMLNNKSYIVKLYSLSILVMTLNLVSFAFIEDSSVVLGYTLLLFELIGISALIFYTYQSKPSIFVLAVSLAAAIGASTLASFILTKDVPTLILTIVIDQLLGISLSSYNFLGLFIISKNWFFIFHFAEFAFLGTFLLLTKKRISVWNLVILGLDVSYPPLIALRMIVFIILTGENQNIIYYYGSSNSTTETATSS